MLLDLEDTGNERTLAKLSESKIFSVPFEGWSDRPDRVERDRPIGRTMNHERDFRVSLSCVVIYRYTCATLQLTDRQTDRHTLLALRCIFFFILSVHGVRFVALAIDVFFTMTYGDEIQYRLLWPYRTTQCTSSFFCPLLPFVWIFLSFSFREIETMDPFDSLPARRPNVETTRGWFFRASSVEKNRDQKGKGRENVEFRTTHASIDLLTRTPVF